MERTKVLLILEVVEIEERIKRELGAAGYLVCAPVMEVEKIFKTLDEQKPDILLLDINYKLERGGIAVARYIREKVNIPIIFLCPYVSVNLIEEIPYFDTYGIVFSPFRSNEIISAIEVSLDQLNKERWVYSILNGLSEGVIATDKDGRIKYSNDLAKTYIGVEVSREITGQKLQHILEHKNNDWGPEVFEPTEEYFKSQLHKTVDSRLEIEQQIVPVEQRDGKKQGWLFVLKDISEKNIVEQKLKQSLAKLRRAMGGVIQAMAMTVEIRDPYTAGHQRRVAHLARAIGNEMGLDPEKVNGLRMAGVIHDLGKIYIPVEILTKPSKLTDLEFGLIKQHPEIAFDILKRIEFPWPVAQIVKQHHERIDGSGYPLGLKGEEIMIESKILAVADVVEAMTSSRPYRPPLGWRKAVRELKEKSGIIYDNEVINAYLRLVRAGEFTIA